MANEPRPAPKTLSPLKRFFGFLMLLAVIVVAGALGVWMRLREGSPGPSAVAAAPLVAHVIVAVMGAIGLVFGALVYALLVATRCFTFDFSTPVYRPLKARLWLANLVVGLFVTIGFGLMMAPALALALAPLLPPGVVGLLAFFLPLVVLQFVLAWLNLWSPVELALIRRRQEALGVAPEVQAQGLFVGVSDPSRSSWKKFGRIEEDLGILWLHPAALIYRGDATGWDLPAPGVVAVERSADSGATSSYFGASGVVLRTVDAYGRESRIRLHPQGAWTLTGQARRLDELAERLQAWKDEAAAHAAPASHPPPLSPSRAGAEPA